MGRCFAAWYSKRGAPRRADVRRYSRLSLLSGRLTVSLSWPNIAGLSSPAPCLPVTRTARFVSRPAQPRRYSKPTPGSKVFQCRVRLAIRRGPHQGRGPRDNTRPCGRRRACCLSRVRLKRPPKSGRASGGYGYEASVALSYSAAVPKSGKATSIKSYRSDHVRAQAGRVTASALAAIETERPMVGRWISECKRSNHLKTILRSSSVSPSWYSTAIGRELVSHPANRSIVIDVRGGQVRLISISAHGTVHGSDENPASWTYQLHAQRTGLY